jgi:hypothetical protein
MSTAQQSWALFIIGRQAEQLLIGDSPYRYLILEGFIDSALRLAVADME